MRSVLRHVSTFAAGATAILVLVGIVAGPRAGAQVPPASSPTSPAVAQYLQQYQALPRMTVPVISGGAAVVIVKFTDYQCPACALTHSMYKPILEKYEAQFPGAVKVITKDFPLDKTCNSWLMQSIHTASCAAAVGVALARKESHAAELEDWLYANRERLTPDTVRKATELIGGVKDFSGGYARAMDQVKADIGLARLLDVNSTPTFFINGVKVAQVLQPEFFDAAIAYELRRAGRLK